MHISHAKMSVPAAFTPQDEPHGQTPQRPERGGPGISRLFSWQVVAYLAIALAAFAAAILLNDAGVTLPVLPAGAVP